jgi:hypothetical protein
MSGEVNVGKLLVTIAADVSDLKKGRQEATKELGALDKSVAAVNRTLGAFGVSLGVQQLAQFAADVVRSAAAIGNLADQAGLSVQQFQGLAHALRDAQVPQEQLAQGMAVFARNMSDLQRNTGPFLDFLRQSKPEWVAQFQGARDTGEAFGILTDAVNRLGSQQDRLRLLNAAGADAFGRFASVMRQGRGAIEAAADAHKGYTEEQVRALQAARRQWGDFWDWLVLRSGQGLAAASRATAGIARNDVAAMEAALSAMQQVRANAVAAGQRDLQRIDRDIARLKARIEEARLAADNIGGAPSGASDESLGADAIRKAQGELAKYLAQIQAIPNNAQFASKGFEEAWKLQEAVLRQQSALKSEIAAARIAMLRQEEAERLRVLGGAIQPYEELRRRVEELNRAQELGIITTEQHGRAMEMASAAGRDAYLSATSAIGQAVARVFEGNKGVAVAAAIIDTLAAANKALAAPPGPPVSYAYVAAALATGFANVRAIMSTSKNSTAASTPAAAAPAPVAPEAAAPGRAIHIQGVDRAMFYSGAALEELIGALNNEVRNGGTLISSGVRPI